MHRCETVCRDKDRKEIARYFFTVLQCKRDFIMNKILIVEADFKLAERLCRALTDNETHAFSCGTLEAASALLESEQYQQIIIDTELPDGDGYDLIYDLGMGIYESNDVPVILVASNDQKPDMTELSEQGLQTVSRNRSTCLSSRRRSGHSSNAASAISVFARSAGSRRSAQAAAGASSASMLWRSMTICSILTPGNTAWREKSEAQPPGTVPAAQSGRE